jgi:hypothetical protein
MSYNYNFHPKVNNPHMSNNIPQTRSGSFQTPFFFGASQVPSGLMLSPHSFNGSGIHHFRSGSPSMTHLGELDFTTKKSSKDYHRGHHLVKGHPYGNGFHKGSKSKTHIGDMDFTTKSGDKVYHRKGHNVKIPHTLPFSV